MDQATLLGPDLHIGSEIVTVLDAADINPSVAMYMVDSDYGDWQLAIASPKLDQEHRVKAFEQIFNALHGKLHFAAPQIAVFPMNDPMVRELRKRFADAGDITGARLRHRTIGNRFIEDAYIYRVQ